MSQLPFAAVLFAVFGIEAMARTPTEPAPAKTGVQSSQPAEQNAERYAVTTIPTTDIMNLASSQLAAKRRDWRQVEQTLARLRQARQEFGQSHNELYAFYSLLADPKFTGSNDYAQHLEQLANWRKELPDSSAAYAVAANVNIHFAWQARGDGTADKVTANGWALFATRIAEARKLIDQALKLGAFDGEAYRTAINVALGEGGPKQQAYDWLGAGRKLDPTYFPMYETMAIYLLPRWHGEAGEVEKFAGQLQEALAGDIGLEAAGRVAFTVHGYGERTMYGDALCYGQFDHPLLVRAAETLCQRHPENPRYAHFAALCAMVTQDHQAAKRIRPLLTRFNAEHKIWLWEQSYNHFWAWSGVAESPASESNRVWATQGTCAGIAYGPDARHVWCAQQYGRTSVNLLNGRTGEMALGLPHPGGTVNALAVDNTRGWVVTAAWRGKFVGWCLYDLRSGGQPQNHATAEKCDFLAIHPKLPLIYWSESKTLRSWDVEENRAGPDIQLPAAARKIRFSPDGSSIAVDMRRIVVYDADSGDVKYELPYAAAQPKPPIDCKWLLDFDDENRLIVHAVIPAGTTNKVPVVRFAADGSSYETVLADTRSSESYLSADRRLLAVARVPDAGPSPIEVWDMASGQRIKRFAGHWNRVGQMEFSPDGRKLASIGRQADVVKIWSLDDIVEINVPAIRSSNQ